MGKISIEHVTIFPRKYLCKDAVDVKSSPDAVTTQIIHHTNKTKHISSEIKLYVIKWKDAGKKHWTTEIYFILCTKAFVGNDSFKTPVGETSLMHCSGVILAHSSTVFKSWRFCGSLLWTLIFSSYFQLDSNQVSIGIKSGDWLAIQAALFYLSESNWEFVWLCLGSLFAEMSTLVSSSSPWYCRCWDWTR